MPEMIELIGKHGERVTFNGELLAGASSDDGKAMRWVELRLYVQDSGVFTLHRISRSAVYHAAGSSCSSQAQPVEAAELCDLDADLVACRHCGVEDVCDLPDGAMVLREIDQPVVITRSTARSIVNELKQFDREKEVYFLSPTARRLLEVAAMSNSAIRRVVDLLS